MDPMIQLALCAAALIVGVVLLWPKPSKPLPSIRAGAATLRATNPGRQFFDQVEENAKERAGAAILDKLASVRADDHASMFGRAFAPPPSEPPKQ